MRSYDAFAAARVYGLARPARVTSCERLLRSNSTVSSRLAFESKPASETQDLLRICEIGTAHKSCEYFIKRFFLSGF